MYVCVQHVEPVVAYVKQTFVKRPPQFYAEHPCFLECANMCVG